MHSHPHYTPSTFSGNDKRFQLAQRSTWVSVFVNLFLTLVQIVVGWIAHSQALIADGLHSLSDLLSDFLVLYANRRGNDPADSAHPYGHGRIETAATLILGTSLSILGLILLLAAAFRLRDHHHLPQVAPLALWIAILTLACKEALYHYLMRVARELQSNMLAANAWHSRSDAASSLVVVVGIIGNMMGYLFLDLIAAAIVGFLIIRMGIKLAYDSLKELIDTGLDEPEVKAIRATILETPGVKGLHELRTRRMAHRVLIDAHVLVDPYISVSEGHHIAENVRQRLMSNHEIIDALVHIDAEEDIEDQKNHLPNREELLSRLHQGLGDALPKPNKTTFHYLSSKVEVELSLPLSVTNQPVQLKKLEIAIKQLLANDPVFSQIHLRFSLAL